MQYRVLTIKIEPTNVPVICPPNTAGKINPRLPPQFFHPAHIEQLFHGPVRFAGVEGQFSVKPHGFLDEFGQFPDGAVPACSQVDEAGGGIGGEMVSDHGVREVHDKHAAVGHVVHVEKFTPGGSGSPDHHTVFFLDFRLVEFPDQGREHVGGFQVEVVVGAIEIGGHHGDEPGAVLPVVSLAHLDSRDLGNGVGLIRGFEKAGEQMFLFHGLGCVFRIDARGAEKQKAVHLVFPGGMDDVALNDQVVVDELGRIAVVGMNPAHFGGGEKDVFRLAGFEKPADLGLVSEIHGDQLHGQVVQVFGTAGVKAARKICVPFFGQVPDDGAAHHARGSGNEDSARFIHFL